MSHYRCLNEKDCGWESHQLNYCEAILPCPVCKSDTIINSIKGGMVGFYRTKRPRIITYETK